jgi:hypothetical protein
MTSRKGTKAQKKARTGLRGRARARGGERVGGVRRAEAALALRQKRLLLVALLTVKQNTPCSAQAAHTATSLQPPEVQLQASGSC